VIIARPSKSASIDRNMGRAVTEEPTYAERGATLAADRGYLRPPEWSVREAATSEGRDGE